MESGESWEDSVFVREAVHRERTKRTGAEIYVQYKDLVKAHGPEKADELRIQKRLKQQMEGDAYEGCPHHLDHPDFGKDPAS